MKPFVNSSQSAPKVPWTHRPTGFALQIWLYLPFSCLEHCWTEQILGILGTSSGQMEPGTTVASLSGRKGYGSLQATLNFPNRLSSWDGLRATLSFGCEWIPLPMCNKGTLHTQCWFCSEDNQLFLSVSCLECHWATLLSRIPITPSGQMWMGDTLSEVYWYFPSHTFLLTLYLSLMQRVIL